MVAKRDRFDRGVRAVIEDGIRRRVFRQGDANLYTFAILGAANLISRWCDPAGDADSDEIATTFAGFLVAGLLARP